MSGLYQYAGHHRAPLLLHLRGLSFLGLLCISYLVLSTSLSLSACPVTEHRPHLSRRSLLSSTAASSFILATSLHPATASPLSPVPESIKTAIIFPDAEVGVQLYDTKIGSTSYVSVKAVKSDSLAAMSGVQEGMIVLGKSENNASTILNRIKNGPYPMILQFYDLAEGEGALTPSQALMAAQTKANSPVAPPLSAKGTGLIVKTTRKAPNCKAGSKENARRGDTVEIAFEARVASPGGPIYDSTEQRGQNSVTFVLGSNESVKGVDIGMYDMCEGEVRELDIPNLLGYGRAGSDYFDVPGDVRLWWRVELLRLTKADNKRAFF